MAFPKFLLRALILAVALSASGARAADVVADARAALPAAIRDSGVLKVATSLQWPPFDYLGADKAPDGIDIRLVQLLAGKLGLRAQIDDVKFPAIVPGVSSGRYDIGVDQIGITAERLKVVDFLPYYDSGYSLLIRRGETGMDIGHLCGHTLLLTQGSAQVGVVAELSAACVKAGEKPIGSILFPDSADTYLALANGRGDGFLTDRAVGVYIAKGNDKLAMAPGGLADRHLISGIVIARGDTALRQALLLAMQSAVSDGSYRKILDDFGAPEGALTVQQISAPAQP